jgi:hypothetical protein
MDGGFPSISDSPTSPAPGQGGQRWGLESPQRSQGGAKTYWLSHGLVPPRLLGYSPTTMLLQSLRKLVEPWPGHQHKAPLISQMENGRMGQSDAPLHSLDTDLLSFPLSKTVLLWTTRSWLTPEPQLPICVVHPAQPALLSGSILGD